jgi:hypothetical protein
MKMEPDMGDTAEEPVVVFEESFESNAATARAGTPRTPAPRPRPGKAGAAGRVSSEAATLICAVSVAVALGISCGAWINARLASAASMTPPAPARLLPVAGADGREAAATSTVAEPGPAVHNDTSTLADEIAHAPGVSPEPVAEAPRTDPAGTAGEAESGKHGRGLSTQVASEPSPPATPAATPAAPLGGGKRATAGPGPVAPCALPAGAGSLTIRNGVAATLVVGGPGEAGRVAVSTPDWSDIAVFSEGRAGGNGGARYSVRSVSKRAGVYTVRFTTPCGSQTIAVTVIRQ